MRFSPPFSVVDIFCGAVSSALLAAFLPRLFSRICINGRLLVGF